jgi:regulation of enolase protein 1 (concanavalin A-like superfamily)
MFKRISWAGSLAAAVVATTLVAAESGAPQVVEGWGVAFDPNGDCQFLKQGDRLSIIVPGTLHTLSPTAESSNAPRILRPVEGDFTVEVKLTGATVAEPGTAVAAKDVTNPYRRAGPLVWQDRENFALLSRWSIADDKKSYLNAGYLVVQNGLGTINATRKIDDHNLALRLTRRGNILEATISKDDGKTWLSLGSDEVQYSAKVTTGVTAIQATTKPFTAEFERFEVAKGGR